jgi:5-methylcytosine-specific restriction endonuclease McrA
MIDRKKVYEKYGGRCAYCGNIILFENMQVDHKISKRDGGTDNEENLNPACRTCNHYKRAFGIEGFRKRISGLHERIKKSYTMKVAIRYGILKITWQPFDGKFYFEKVKDGLL